MLWDQGDLQFLSPGASLAGLGNHIIVASSSIKTESWLALVPKALMYLEPCSDVVRGVMGTFANFVFYISHGSCTCVLKLLVTTSLWFFGSSQLIWPILSSVIDHLTLHERLTVCALLHGDQ